jgi:hypothetical protein
MESSRPEPDPTYLQLRKRILRLTPPEVGLPETSPGIQVWGVIMETGYEVGIATLVVFFDGTTSLYFSTGGGMLGSSDYSPLAKVAQTLVTQAEGKLSQMSSAKEIDIPSAGQVRFTFLTYSGLFTSIIPEESLASANHSLSQLYASGRETITQLRLVKDRKGI